MRADSFTLVLVNRILDRTGDSGLAFISSLKEDSTLASVPVMLVSNFPDAQRQAMARGSCRASAKRLYMRREPGATCARCLRLLRLPRDAQLYYARTRG